MHNEREILVKEIAERIREILKLIGEDIDREGIKETPERYALALLEMTKALRDPQPEIKSFSLSESQGQLVILRNISFSSICEHHLLPFIGKIDIIYEVGDEKKIIGLSKLIRLVNYYSSKPQIQERLVNEIADAIMRSDASPKGVVVAARGIHMCVYARGVKDREAKFFTYAVRGTLESREIKEEVLKSVIHGKKKTGINL